ncbi:MAG: glycosyltransferase family 1 protein [Candidatus Thermoplasmatota archaeon]|nr:glycosyltransferase family 1 protein [Candidatus Thermoplasmatota archaeon]
MPEPLPGVTIVTNDTNPETGLGRTTWEPYWRLAEQAEIPVRLAVLDKHAREVRVHEDGEVDAIPLLRLPEHRYMFFARAARKVPLGEINHVTNQVLSYLPLPNKVVTVHDLFFRTEDLSLAYKLHSYWLYPPIRNALHCLANSHATAEEACRVLDMEMDRFTVLPMGVDAERFDTDRSRFEARRELGLPPDSPILFHLSTETPRKNVDGILGALRVLVHDLGYEDLLFVKAGNATRKQDRQRHLDLVQDLDLAAHVRFVGYVDDDDLPLYYRASDALLFPSHQEGFGLPVLEAMAAGTPVVTSTTSALPEAAGDAALLADPKDPAAMAKAVDRILSDPELTRELVAKGRARSATFTWDATAQAQAAAYEEILASLR